MLSLTELIITAEKCIIKKRERVEHGMETLIELYDERAIENILAPDMFRPQRIIYLCPGEIVQIESGRRN